MTLARSKRHANFASEPQPRGSQISSGVAQLNRVHGISRQTFCGILITEFPTLQWLWAPLPRSEAEESPPAQSSSDEPLPRMGSTFDPQPKETQPLAETGDEQHTALIDGASADPLSMRLDRLPSAGKQGGPQPVRDPNKEMGGPDRTSTVRGFTLDPRASDIALPQGDPNVTLVAVARDRQVHHHERRAAGCPRSRRRW